MDTLDICARDGRFPVTLHNYTGMGALGGDVQTVDDWHELGITVGKTPAQSGGDSVPLVRAMLDRCAELDMMCFVNDSRCTGHVMVGGGSNEGVSERRRVRNMERDSLAYDVGVHRQKAFGKGWNHTAIEPSAEDLSLRGIPSFREQHAELELVKRNHRHEHELGWNATSPLGDSGIRFSSLRFAKLGYHVGVEDEHQSKLAGWAESRQGVVSRSVCSTPAGSPNRSMMLGWLAARRW